MCALSKNVSLIFLGLDFSNVLSRSLAYFQHVIVTWAWIASVPENVPSG